jgi:hypothetical protein
VLLEELKGENWLRGVPWLERREDGLYYIPLS